MSLNQDNGKGCCHLMTWLELGDLVPNGLAHMSMLLGVSSQHGHLFPSE